MKFLKWVLGGVGVIVVLGVAAVLILPQVVPMDRVVAEAEAQVQAATGRKLTVGGEPELSLWPEVAIRVGDVAFANAAGAPDPNMATAEAVRIAVPVLPLLSGEIEVKEFVLVKPDIRLYVDKNGKPNWAFDAGQAAGGGQASGGQASGGGAASGGLPPELKGLKLGDVRIEDGRVSYTDARTGATETAENIDMAVSLPSMAGPLALDGGLDWKGESIKLDLQMAKPAAATEGGKSALALKTASTHFEASFDGEADFAKGFALAGAAAFKTPSLKALAAWAAQPIEMEGDVLGPVEAKGQLALSDGRFAFTGADLAIDAIRGKGDFALATGGAVPAITAKLALGALDLNPYMGSPKAGGGSDGGGGGSEPAKWSDAPIDFSALKSVNADLDLAVESLKIQEIEIGQSALTAALKGGVLNLDLAKMALYGGSGTVQATVDASKATPTFKKTLKVSGIDAQPLLTDAAGFDRLSGKGDLNLAITAAGASEAAIVKSMDGNGGFVFKDGAITGFNLGAMMRQVESAFLDASAGKQEQTDFSELTATFKIENGVVSNDDLAMLSPLFRVKGEGTVDAPARTVNYRVVPKAVASTTGQGGATDLAGVKVPVLITGPWHDISYAPDLSGAVTDLVKDPSKAVDAVKGAAGGAKELLKDPAGAAKDLLPGKDADPTKALKGLFGK